MNIKFHTLLADVTGKTSIAFIEAILKGERNVANFLCLVDRRIKANRDDILKSLEGNWRSEYLFTLRQSYKMYKTLQQHIAECDAQIEMQLQQYEAKTNEMQPFFIIWLQKKNFKPLDLAQYQEKYKQAKIAFYERKLNELKSAAA